MPWPLLADAAPHTVEDVAHIIQLALTPVFMLSGIGTLLNLFNTRLARVSDHLRTISDLRVDETDPARLARLERHLRRLHRRLLMLDCSIFLAAVGGASTCCAALVLFLGSVGESTVSSALVVMFGLALLCTVAALSTFLADSLFAWHGIRTEGPLPQRRDTA
jgi:hypothetical protein